MNYRKIGIVLLFVASVIVFGSLLYYFFFRNLITPGDTPPPVTNGSLPTPTNGNISVVDNQNTRPELPSFSGNTINVTAPTDVAQGGLTKVTDHGLTALKGVTSDIRGPRFYSEENGLFYRLDGTVPVALSDQRFFNVESVTWARNQDKAILEYPDGSNIVYDFATNKQVTLPKEFKGFSFDVSGNQIAAKWEGDNTDENWLMLGSSDGSNFRLVEPLGDRGANVAVDYSPDNQVVALYRKANDATSQAIIPIGANGENFKQFIVDGLNFQSKWSPAGGHLLYSAANSGNEYNPVLHVTGGSTDNLGVSHLDLKLSTWPSKCTFNTEGTSIFCAEPTQLPRGAGLYPELARGIPDAFYRIDLRSGQKIPLAFPVGNQSSYSADSVFLSSDESLLYFMDVSTNRLHSIRLR